MPQASLASDLLFTELIRRVRARDEQAAAEIVRSFEPAIRWHVRERLTDPELRRQLDPPDISQMVLASFFARVAEGEYELANPRQLSRLLKTMARNKLVHELMALRTIRRGGGVRRKPLYEEDCVDPRPDPGQEAVEREFLRRFEEGMSAQDRWLHDQRCAGRSWAALAAETGSSPAALRMRHARSTRALMRDLDPGE